MANVKITDLTALSGALVDADLFEMVDDVAGTPASRKVTAAVLRDFGGMAYAASSPTTGDIAAVVNTIYYVDVSGLTAARNLVLPATAAVGDRVGVYVSVTHATVGRELILKADTGDSIVGPGGTFTATEWSRVWQVGECVVFRCVVANSTWIVESDGRIPQAGLLRLSTNATAESAGTMTVYTDKSGVWTADVNRGSVTSTSNGRIYARRGGIYMVGGTGANVSSMTDAQYYAIFTMKNTSTRLAQNVQVAAATGQNVDLLLNGCFPLATGDYTEQTFQSQAGSRGGSANATTYNTSHFSLEQL